MSGIIPSPRSPDTKYQNMFLLWMNSHSLPVERYRNSSSEIRQWNFKEKIKKEESI
jgi:hypothetical protein